MRRILIDNLNEVSGGAGFWEDWKQKREGKSLLKQYEKGAKKATTEINDAIKYINNHPYKDHNQLRNIFIPMQMLKLASYQEKIEKVKRDYGI